jgi:hypothetical protein
VPTPGPPGDGLRAGKYPVRDLAVRGVTGQVTFLLELNGFTTGPRGGYRASRPTSATCRGGIIGLQPV